MEKSIKILYWSPRIICILAILFVSIFALDAFNPQLNFWQQISGFLIHLIPSFVFVVLLFVAWKYEYIGGIILVLLGLVFSVVVFRMNYRINESILMSIGIITSITVPFIIAGILFIIGHFKKKSLNTVTS